MSKNAQILLESLIEQEFQNNDNYSSISDYFEFFSASQILKNQGNDNYPVKEDHIIWRRCCDEVENHIWQSSGFIKNNN